MTSFSELDRQTGRRQISLLLYVATMGASHVHNNNVKRHLATTEREQQLLSGVSQAMKALDDLLKMTRDRRAGRPAITIHYRWVTCSKHTCMERRTSLIQLRLMS